MEQPNVNNLNGIPNFGHGLPTDGIVQAGLTDFPQELEDNEEINEEESAEEDDTNADEEAETDNVE